MGIMQLLMSSVASGGGEYVDGLFETTVYPSSTNAIDVESGIDNLNEGGMVWIKNRDNNISNSIYSTANPATSSTSDHRLRTDTTDGLQNTGPSTGADGTITWNSDGWTGANGKSYIIENGYGDYVAYNFRKCAGFFDMVTYNGSPSVQSIAHNLGCVPGCIMVKKTNGAGNWMVYHKHMDPSAPQDYNLKLDTTNYRQDKDTVWNDTAPTKTHFTVCLLYTSPSPRDRG